MEHSLWQILNWSWLASEILLVLVTRTRQSTGNVQDRGSIYVLWAVIFASIWTGSWYGDTHPHTLLAGARWLRPASLVLLSAGLAIRWTSILSLGRAFSVNVAIRSGQTLYRRGLFSIVRHPSYLGMLIIFLALGLRLQSRIALAIILIPPLLALLYRIDVEEAALTRAFVAEYRHYTRTTKRLIPGLY